VTRLLYGILGREGMRVDEALSLIERVAKSMREIAHSIAL
jgi:hypothetical protein